VLNTHFDDGLFNDLGLHLCLGRLSCAYDWIARRSVMRLSISGETFEDIGGYEHLQPNLTCKSRSAGAGRVANAKDRIEPAAIPSYQP
jgi:hypothetical protein